MTRHELNQIYYINREIEMWQRELDNLKSESSIKGQAITGMPHSNTNLTSDPTAAQVMDIERIENIIKGKLAEIQVQRKKIMEFVDGVEDSMLRQVIFYRCISTMSWKLVAAHIGGGNTADSLRMMFNRFFDEN